MSFDIASEDELPNAVKRKLEADIQQSQSIAIVVRSNIYIIYLQLGLE